jgi:hypothetical protein
VHISPFECKRIPCKIEKQKLFLGCNFFCVYKRTHSATFLLMKFFCHSWVKKYFSTNCIVGIKNVFDQNNFS